MDIPQVSILVVDFGLGSRILTAIQSLGYPVIMVSSNQLGMTDFYRYTHIILSDSMTSLTDCQELPDATTMLRILKSRAKILGVGFGYHLLVYYTVDKLAVIRRLPLLHRNEYYIRNKWNLTDPNLKYSFNHVDYVSALNEKWDILDYMNIGFKNQSIQAITIGKTKRTTGVSVMGIQFNPEEKRETYGFFRTWIEWA
jgi:anthranilate/para-aminobenzoate synthase component II